jgi:hypothetical protein
MSEKRHQHTIPILLEVADSILRCLDECADWNPSREEWMQYVLSQRDGGELGLHENPQFHLNALERYILCSMTMLPFPSEYPPVELIPESIPSAANTPGEPLVGGLRSPFETRTNSEPR